MANRYWVGGNGNWNDTAHWSTSSGGASGASIPTSADDVILDTAPGGPQNFPIIKIGTARNAVCNNLTFAAGTATTLDESGLFGDNITIHGSLDMATQTGFGSYITKATFVATSTGKTIKGFKGFTQPAINHMVLNGVGGEWTLTAEIGDARSIPYQDEPMYKLELIRGSLITNGYAVYCNNFICSGDQTRSLTLGSSVIHVFGDKYAGDGTSKADFSGTNFTFDAGTSSIEVGVIYNNFYETNIYQFIGAGRTFYNVKLNQRSRSNRTANVGKIVLTGSNVYNNLTISSIWYYSGSSIETYVMNVDLSEDQTVNGTFTVTSTPFNAATDEIRIYITPSVPVTITANAVALDHVDFRNVFGDGTATWEGTRLGDQGGNSNITFEDSRELYWVGNQGSWTTFSGWSLTSGGTGGEKLPLPQDTVYFDANSFSANNQKITVNFPFLGYYILFQDLDVVPIFYSYYASSGQIIATEASFVEVLSSLKFERVNLTTETLTFDNAPITITTTQTTFTITDQFGANGTVDDLLTLTGDNNIRAAVAYVSYIAVNNSHALGAGIPFDARIGGIDNGNNIDWLFQTNSHNFDDLSTSLGVYSFGSYSKDYPKVLDMSYALSVGLGDDIEIGSILVEGADMFVAWRKGDQYGIDYLDWNTKAYISYLETMMLTAAQARSFLKTAQAFFANYKQLPDGCDIIFSYKKKYETNYTILTSINDTLVNQKRAEESIPDVAALQIKIDFVTSYNDAPEVESFGFKDSKE